MSIDKSLVGKGKLVRHRNVLTRPERIKFLTDEGLWDEGKVCVRFTKSKNIEGEKEGKSG